MNSILHYSYIKYFIIFNICFTTFLLSMPGREIEDKSKKRKLVNQDNEIEEAKKQKIEDQSYIDNLSTIEAKIFKELEDKSNGKLVLIFSYHIENRAIALLDTFKEFFDSRKSLFQNIATDSNHTYFPSQIITKGIRDIKNLEYFIVYFNIREQIMYRNIKVERKQAKRSKIAFIDKQKRAENDERNKERKKERIQEEYEKYLKNREKDKEQAKIDKNYVYTDELSIPELLIWKEIEKKNSGDILLIFHFHKKSHPIKILYEFRIHFNNKKTLLNKIRSTDIAYYENSIKRGLGILEDIEYLIIIYNPEKKAMYKYLKKIYKEKESEKKMGGRSRRLHSKSDEIGAENKELNKVIIDDSTFISDRNSSNDESGIDGNNSEILESTVIDFNELIKSFKFDITYKKLLEFLKLNITDDQLNKLEQNYSEEWVLKIKKLFTMKLDEEFIKKSEEVRKWVQEKVTDIEKKEEELTKKFISENISTQEGTNDFMKYINSLIEGTNKLEEITK